MGVSTEETALYASLLFYFFSKNGRLAAARIRFVVRCLLVLLSCKECRAVCSGISAERHCCDGLAELLTEK